MNRRAFLGGAAGTALLPVWAGASPERKSTPEELAAWKATVLERGEPLVYRALEQPQAAFPAGGIGCGNVYVGVGGHLKDWLLFNNLSPVQVPNSFFALRASVGDGQPVARTLQTETIGLHVVGPFGGSFRYGTKAVPAPGPGVRDVELRGEYPSAFLRYVDPALPVEVRLETFTPWIPLDARSSAMPATVFLFRVKNPAQTEAKVSLLAAMHNAAGFGGPGGNVNEGWRGGGAAGLRMSIRPGRVPKLDRAAELAAGSAGFRLPEVERPEGLNVRALNPLGPSPAALTAEAGKRTILWLEDAESLSPQSAAALRKSVEAGATLVLTGSGTGLLGRWSGALQPQRVERPDIAYENFESGRYEKWKATGTAFGSGPQTGTLPGQQAVSGFQGKFLVNSFTAGDAPRGRLTSEPFTIERRFIRFLIGGGAHAGRTCMNLLVDGRVIRTATGKELERLEPFAWDVHELEGQTARLEIVDEESTGWGHINIDEIVFGDRPGEALPAEVARELAALLPVAYDGTAWTPGVVTLALPGTGRDTQEPLRLGGRVRLEGARPQPGASALSGVAGEGVLWQRSVGKGRVVLLAAPLLPSDQRGSRAAREQALRFLAHAAGLKYEAGSGIHPHDPAFGELCLVAGTGRVTGLAAWEDPAELWSAFTEERLEPLTGRERTSPTPPGLSTNGAVAAEVTVPPGGEVTVPFFLTWRFPNYYFEGRRLENRYAELWGSAGEVAGILAKDWSRLRDTTERYRQTVYDTTLPYWLVDSLTSQSSTIRSEVCVWLADGTFAGYEGSDGCCPMNCSHVWGYEQSLARLFPELEKAMRETDYKHQQRTDGGVNNRVVLPVQPGPTGETPFTDGHASGVLKAYREHLNSPDASWLREYWPNVKKAVDFLVSLDGTPADGVIEGPQPNTYDCTVFGPNTFIGSYYLAALRAGEEMARLMGEEETARRWHAIFKTGQGRLVELCWTGEYFRQNLPDYAARPTQWGPGCLADQLIGQWWAHQLRLGYLLPKGHVQTTLRSIFKYNWLWDFSDFRHNQRVYADRHDKGLLNCTWPHGGRPSNPILYCDEVWTGVEYQVAAHMVYEGMLEEAFTIVKGARERYDGRRRNPWNELECGGHYARAMANWSLLLGTSGFFHDGPRGLVAFDPVYRPEEFRSLFTTAEGWGSFAQSRSEGRQRNELRLDHGRLRLRELELGTTGRPAGITVRHGGRTLESTPRLEAGKLRLPLPEGTVLSAGETLTVEIR